jgi:hypothetical protein
MMPRNRMGLILGAALAVATGPLVLEPQKVQPREPDPPRPPPPRPDPQSQPPRALAREPYVDPKPPGHNGSRAMARRVRQMERAAAKAAKRGEA